LEKTVVYLDSNVVIDVLEGREDELLGLFVRSLHIGPYCYPFSAELLSEITDINYADRNRQRMLLVSNLSLNIYFENSFNSIGFTTKPPQQVFDTITEAGNDSDVFLHFSNLIPFEHIVKLRAEYELEPSVLNNMEPLDAINAIEAALANHQNSDGTGGVESPRSLREMVSEISNIVEESFKGVGQGLGEQVKHDEPRNDLIIFFSLLDSFGYWGDPKKKYAKGSRFIDAQHALAGSYYGAVVSRDNHYIHKARAAYDYMGITTKTYSTEEFKAHLKEVLGSQ